MTKDKRYAGRGKARIPDKIYDRNYDSNTIAMLVYRVNDLIDVVTEMKKRAMADNTEGVIDGKLDNTPRKQERSGT